MIRTSCYLVIRPERRGYDGAVQGIEIDRVVKTKPKLGVRDVAIKLNLQVDERLFTVPEPEVTINLDDRRALVVPKVDIDVPEGLISAEEAAPLALATEVDPENDEAYLAGIKTLAEDGNPVAIALLEAAGRG